MIRHVLVDGKQYDVDILPSSPVHRQRLGTRWYVQVELPGVWRAVLPAPPGIQTSTQLWYRELIELVMEAQRLVRQRRPVAGNALAAD